jgi:hypothetical protein
MPAPIYRRLVSSKSKFQADDALNAFYATQMDAYATGRAAPSVFMWDTQMWVSVLALAKQSLIVDDDEPPAAQHLRLRIAGLSALSYDAFASPYWWIPLNIPQFHWVGALVTLPGGAGGLAVRGKGTIVLCDSSRECGVNNPAFMSDVRQGLPAALALLGEGRAGWDACSWKISVRQDLHQQINVDCGVWCMLWPHRLLTTGHLPWEGDDLLTIDTAVKARAKRRWIWRTIAVWAAGKGFPPNEHPPVSAYAARDAACDPSSDVEWD